MSLNRTLVSPNLARTSKIPRNSLIISFRKRLYLSLSGNCESKNKQSQSKVKMNENECKALMPRSNFMYVS